MGNLRSQLEQERGSAETRAPTRPTRPWWTLYAQFERTGALGDLEKAIENIQRALSLTSDDHPDRPIYLHDLGISLESRFWRTEMLSDLDEAIESQRQAVFLTPDDHPDKPMFLNHLGISLESRFKRTRMTGDLEEAVKNQRQAVSLASDDHPDKPEYLYDLGVSLENQFGHTGMLSDLDEAIKSHRQAISLTLDTRVNKPVYLSHLGNSLEDRFESTGMLSDLNEAITIQRQAVSLTPDDHPNQPMYFNDLGNSLESRFRRTGMLSDLEDAIESQRWAVSLIPDDHDDKPKYLNNLGCSFESRFGRAGTLSGIEKAIKIQRQAVSLTLDDHPNKPMYLNNLGISLGSRFGRTGMMCDLEEAIRSKQQAVFLTPNDQPDKPIYLNNLGNSFESRFGCTGTLSDLEEAIKSKRQAISLTPNDHPNKPMYFNNLGSSFQSRFGNTGMLNDLTEAIINQRQAVSLTSDDHLNKAMYLNNLGNSLGNRFRSTGMLSDLEDAIKRQYQAVSLTPDDHPDKPEWLNNLGISLEYRFRHTGSPNDLEKAISVFQSAANFNVGSIFFRCYASHKWAHLEAERGLPESALGAYRQTINLLPQAAWIGDPIGARHSQLTSLGDLPREAAAFALDVGRPDLALEWLEQGRSVVWNQLLWLRPSVDHLQQVHPDLCAEFTQISHELQHAVTRGHSLVTSEDITNPISLEDETRRHHRLAEKWELLVQKVRSLPSFQDFLLPRKVSALMEAASSGPVVVINVHKRRCDALVLLRGRDQVLHIPLTKLHYNDVIKTHKSLQYYLTNHHRAGRWENRAGRPAQTVGGSPIGDILEQIYSKVVYPILQGLDMMTARSESSSLPRIWWCPTGPLTFFPLHAACRITGTKTDGTFDYVVSSYTPTITTLLEARLMKHRPFNRLLGIAMTDTPGQKPLPGVGREIVNIQNLFAADSRSSVEILRDEQATGERVLAQMTESSWVHLACHAIQDKQEPTQSGFCLHDRRLTIMDIVAKPFAYADFAFLSACQTATGDEKASDQAIHITGAMLGAGYRNVIGTMWAIPDEAASRIATKVYKILLSGGGLDSNRAAQALRDAMRDMRESDHNSYGFWVPFVHYGA